ncbi:MAG: hypothetical protein ABID79_06180 [Elusimicrobiota bacterium]
MKITVKKIGYFFLSFYFSTYLYSAFEQRYSSARVASLSGAFVALSNDSSAIYYNPGGLRRIVSICDVSTTHCNLYGFNELSYMVGSFALYLKNFGTVGLSYNQFGDSIYGETEFYFSHGFYLTKNLAFGYTMKNMALKIKEYGSGNAVGFDCGFIGNVKDNISIGSSATNFNGPNVGSKAELVSKNFQIGISLKVLERITSNLDVSKSDDFDGITLHISEEINLLKIFAVRFGVRTQPTSFSSGFGLKNKNIGIDYGYILHPVLGGTHLFSLSLKLETHKNPTLKCVK